MDAATHTSPAERAIAVRTKGRGVGITRLMSPGDLGKLAKPFVFLDHFETGGQEMANLPWHPHTGGLVPGDPVRGFQLWLSDPLPLADHLSPYAPA